ncbi:MAG: DUF7882 family protein [Microbacteriaceae bacterium]
MGKFIYGTESMSVELDDRVLAHLKIVIASKLRRGESFLFTWEYSTDSGSGHSSVWLHPAIPLQFEFYGKREPRINRQWLEELIALSNSPTGLRLVPEPQDPPVMAERPGKGAK